MPSAYSIEGAPLTVNVTASSISSVQAAIGNAKPGTILNVTGSVRQEITLNVVKADPGVLVLLPDDLSMKLVGTNSSGVHFVGGTWQSDFALPLTFASYCVDLTNCSKMSFRGCRFVDSRTQILTKDCDDIILARNIMNYNRSDNMQLSGMKRFLVEDVVVQEAYQEWKLGFYPNGLAPVYNKSDIFTRDRIGSTDGARGTAWEWYDASHSDLLQGIIFTGSPRKKHEDVTVRRLELNALFQGVSSFGDGNNSSQTRPFYERLLIEGCKITTDQVGAIKVRGTDMEIRDNIITAHATPGLTPSITVIPLDTAPPTNPVDYGGVAATRVRGGRNTMVAIPGRATPQFIYNESPGSPVITGVDLDSPTINGATVAAPEFPRITFPAWFPTPAMPSVTSFPNLPPEFRFAPKGEWMGTLTAGSTWLSMKRGSVKLFGGLLDMAFGYLDPARPNDGHGGFAYRWVRGDGTVLGTNPMFLYPGGAVFPEAQVKTNKGLSVWVRGAAVGP